MIEPSLIINSPVKELNHTDLSCSDEEYKSIEVGDSLAKVSIYDYDKVCHLRWYKMAQGYAATGHDCIKMHHLILNVTDFSIAEVHHKNGDRLDNRRCNLQVLTFSDHLITRSKQSNNKSGYKGVSWKNPQGNRKGKWIAQIGYNGQKISIGRFDDSVEAAKAYDKKAKELFGSRAHLNFPV